MESVRLLLLVRLDKTEGVAVPIVAAVVRAEAEGAFGPGPVLIRRTLVLARGRGERMRRGRHLGRHLWRCVSWRFRSFSQALVRIYRVVGVCLLSFFADVKRGRVAAEAPDSDNEEEKRQLNLAQTQL